MIRFVRTTMLAFLMALTAAGCAVPSSSGGSASPSPTTRAPEEGRRPTASTRKVDPAEAERLQRVMVPLIRAMNNPLPLNKVKVGIMDDPAINAANAGGGQFFVTTGLLQKANDEQLTGVLAHEVAHEDLKHVAKAQTLGAGLNIGMIILDQIIPGSGALTPIAGELVARGYSRKEEYQADAHGVEILKRAGQSPDIMERTLTWLMQSSGGGSKGGFFSTHPGTGERIEALRKLR
jgi:Zn-dependent protease with chaperone function